MQISLLWKIKNFKTSFPRVQKKRRRMIDMYKILNCVYDLTATEEMFKINERNSLGNPWKLITRKS